MHSNASVTQSASYAVVHVFPFPSRAHEERFARERVFFEGARSSETFLSFLPRHWSIFPEPEVTPPVGGRRQLRKKRSLTRSNQEAEEGELLFLVFRAPPTTVTPSRALPFRWKPFSGLHMCVWSAWIINSLTADPGCFGVPAGCYPSIGNGASTNAATQERTLVPRVRSMCGTVTREVVHFEPTIVHSEIARGIGFFVVGSDELSGKNTAESWRETNRDHRCSIPSWTNNQNYCARSGLPSYRSNMETAWIDARDMITAERANWFKYVQH